MMLLSSKDSSLCCVDMNKSWCPRVLSASGQTGLSTSKTADLLGFSHSTISGDYGEWSENTMWMLEGWKRMEGVLEH